MTTTIVPTKNATPSKTSSGWFNSILADISNWFQEGKMDFLFFVIGLVMVIGSVMGTDVVNNIKTSDVPSGAALLAAGE
jgi:Na+/H+ antiporter NhaD/arsenite permease-like protein